MQYCSAEFLTLGKALLIPLPLYLQMLIMQVSTQTNNHKYRKVLQLKITLFKKMDLKFQNPKFNILFKIAFIFI